MKQNNRKTYFSQVIWGTLAISLLGNALTGKGVIRVGEGTIKAGENF